MKLTDDCHRLSDSNSSYACILSYMRIDVVIDAQYIVSRCEQCSKETSS